RIQKRDLQGVWSVIASSGTTLGQVYYPAALAADAAGNLYVADGFYPHRIQKRDSQGKWSVIAKSGAGVGQITSASALALDAKGNLYVADTGNNRVQKYSVQP